MAALAVNGKHARWTGPYLGTNIPGAYPVEELFNSLKNKKMTFTKTTEQSSKYEHLEKMSVQELLSNINQEDKTVPFAVEKALPQIETLVKKEIKDFIGTNTVKQFEEKLLDMVIKDMKRGKTEKEIKDLEEYGIDLMVRGLQLWN